MTRLPNENSAVEMLSWRRIYVLASGVLAAVGLIVMIALAVPGARDSLLRHLLWSPWKAELAAWMRPGPVSRRAAAPDALLEAAGVVGDGDGAARAQAHVLQHVAHESRSAAEAARRREELALTEFIAKRYRVADEVIARFVTVAFRASADHSVDPLLVLAVVATESRYNPIAESVVGAKGLMQVIAKFHPEKLEEFGGENALLDPSVNIVVGTRILREYQRRYGDLETALQVYAGALDDVSSQYARKVLAERARLQQVVARLRREA